MKNFVGKTVVITGAAGGIGACLVKEFLEMGAKVWALDLDKISLSRMASEAEKYDRSVHTISLDVSSAEEMRKAVEIIKHESKSIEIWINNAGTSGLGDFMKHDYGKFERTIQINLGGVVIGTKLALEEMENLGAGLIVNVASVAGHVSSPYLAAYSASKHGVVGFTRAIREELALKDSPVKLLLVSPGFVDTKMIARGSSEGFPNWMKPLLGAPESVARDIIKGIRKEQTEIIPTWNGKILMKLHRHLPRLTTMGSRLLLTKSIKDLLLMRMRPPS